MSLFCAIDRRRVPAERASRRGYAAVTCSDDCYQEFRKQKKRPSKGRRVSEEEFAQVMQIRRAKAAGKQELTLQV